MVQPKKHLGQHFLADRNVARRIVGLLPPDDLPVLEIGPGTGALTRILAAERGERLHVVEIDGESVEALRAELPQLAPRLHQADFLRAPLTGLVGGDPKCQVMVISNFPYNISSPILFRLIDERERVPLVAGMFQKEVAERIAAPHGNKRYGILSVWAQMFYQVQYHFTVSENVFVPPPKVKSGVITLARRPRDLRGVDPAFLLRVVKAAFNQRRKTLRNSLQGLADKASMSGAMFDLRPEQLPVEAFLDLCLALQGARSGAQTAPSGGN